MEPEVTYTLSGIRIGFPQAIQALTHGHKITRAAWGDDRYYGILRDGLVQLHKPDSPDGTPGGFFAWTISDGDLMGADWLTLD